MSKKYRFPNGVLAGAFAGAVAAAFDEWDENDNYACEAPCPSDFDVGENILECYMDDDVFFIHKAGGAEAKLVNTLARLEAAIAEAITEFRGDSLVLSGYDNGTGHDATFNRDGSVEIGCQEHDKDGVERIIAAAIRVAKGGGFKDFKTGRYTVHKPTKEEIEDGEWSAEEGDIIIGEEAVKAKEIIDLAEQRAAFLKQHEKPEAFSLFAKK